MKPIIRSDGRVVVFIPRKLSSSGKREAKYFPTKSQAVKFIADFKSEQIEHGKQAVTSDDRAIVALLRKELGDLSLVPEVLRHWKLTGEKLNRISIDDAVDEFMSIAEKDYPNRRTLEDVHYRLQRFRDAFPGCQCHEILPLDIERFLEQPVGWDRWSWRKRISVFFKFCKRRRYVAVDPMEDVPKVRIEEKVPEIYSVGQYSAILHAAEWQDEFHPILPYAVLMGMAFCRSSELVRRFASESILQWSDLLWSESLLHVPLQTSKTVERYIPITSAAKAWIQPIRKPYDSPEATGDIVKLGSSAFVERWRLLLERAKVPMIANGLRHSCLSYAIADHGISKVAEYAGNSEATVRRYYRRALKPEAGKAWFNIGA